MNDTQLSEDSKSVKLINLDEIRLDPKAQPRVGTYLNTIEEFALDMGGGAEFPPLIVFFDGQTHWLADGFHRHHAAKALGLVDFHCQVLEGGLREAILYSCSANAAHGLRRTNDDKRRAVKALLADDEWAQWSDNEIARRCGVSQSTVSRLRPDVSNAKHKIGRKVNRGGTTYTQNTANIGSNKPPIDKPSNNETREDKFSEWNRQVLRDHGHIYDALDEIRRQFKRLPEPPEADENFPPMLRHAFTADEARDMAQWLLQFADCYERKQHVAAQ